MLALGRRHHEPSSLETRVHAERERLERLIEHEVPYRLPWLARVDEAWRRFEATHGPDHRSFYRSPEYLELLDEEATRPLVPVSAVMSRACARMTAGDREALITALAYLDLSPRYDCSGYLKETLLRELRRVELDEPARQCLRRVFLAWILRPGREYGVFVKLVPRLRNAGFEAAIEALVDHDNEHVRRRARRLVDAWRRRRSPSS